VDYKLSMSLRASLMLFSTNVLPYFGVVLARRRAMKLLFGADVLAVVAMYAYGPRASGNALSPFYAALHPVGIGSGSRSSSTPHSGPPT
jgi:hypothetical protein